MSIPEESFDAAQPADQPRARASRRAADAVLREHPDAIIFASSGDGQIVPVPDSLGLDGWEILTEEGRTGIDLCVAEDRMAVVNAWVELKERGIAEVRARLRSDPGVWRTVRMLDLRSTHGVVLTVGWIGEQGDDAGSESVSESAVTTTPRFCTRRQDSEGNVIECDEAYLQMFGYEEPEQVIGQPTFERVHPDDQARLIESWVAVVATGRPSMARVRMRRGEDAWLWVDITYHSYLGEENAGYVLAECIDVSAEMAAQEALQDREELLRRLLDEMPDGLLQLDSERRVVYRNPRLLELLHGSHATEADLEGASSPGGSDLEAILAAVSPDGRAEFDAALDEGASVDLELEAHPPGRERPAVLLFKVRPLTRGTTLVTGMIVSVQDVTASANARRELEHRATFDALTGAHNRASILAALSAELEQGNRVGVLYVDLDHFKDVNDTLGHGAGDELLTEVAERLRSTMRSGDELGRLGGDEFLVLLRGVDDLDVAMNAGERISEAVKGRYELPGAPIDLCASIGVALARPGAGDAEQLIERADKAMYRSKQHRRGEPALAA